MTVIMIKPDALTGPRATIRAETFRGLLLGLAHHLDATVPVPVETRTRTEHAARQVAERSSSERAFQARPVRALGTARHLQTEAAALATEQTLSTEQVMIRSLHCLGFAIHGHADHVLTSHDLDAIYPQMNQTRQDTIRPHLVDYLVGQPVRVLWLSGDQHPGVLQIWKTYLRHLAVPRPPLGGQLLRNLVHVCDHHDATYLTRTLTPTKPAAKDDAPMATYSWHTDPVPDQLPVRQVYGFLFDEEGNILLRTAEPTPNGDPKYTLPGGRPEPGETPTDTLRREAYEEMTTVITHTHYLGYQRVDENDDSPPYAQVRMIARVVALHPPQPDPDTGRTYQREFMPPDHVGHLLDWGITGHQQTAAAAVAAAHLLFELHPHDEEGQL